VDHLSHLFRVKPELLAHDMHPGYFTTKYAHGIANIPRIAVQHHHAHIAACMADNKLDDRQVIGLSFDGTGYGTDGKIWGGEILLASYADFERVAHLEYLPLPGGDSATRHPWRIAVGYAEALGLDIEGLPFLDSVDREALRIIRQQVQKKLNSPETSSMGRLFDAVSSMVAIRNEVSYEAQAAMELEVQSKAWLAEANPYPFEIEGGMIRLEKLLGSVIADIRENKPAGWVGARFHHAVTRMVVEFSEQLRRSNGIKEVVLSGGVWQNQVLLDLASGALKEKGFVVFTHQLTPANDGGLSLGQAAIANFKSKNGGLHVS
jgi:hydrogenase maturation protein HypF